MILRPYQTLLAQAIYAAWGAGHRNVGAVLPTGGGKTVLYASIIAALKAPSVVIAHRQELVSQTSLALVRNRIRHRILGQKGLIQWCQNQSVKEVGHNYIDSNAPVAAAGVDTLIRMPATDPWFRQVQLWVSDEFHHLQASNKWGTAVAMFPNARGLGVSATPERADGRGLNAPDGVIDVLVEGPRMRELIDAGFLCDFRIYAPPSDVDLSRVPTGTGGDFSPVPLRAAVHKSHIVGDVVQHYLRLAPGGLGVTFCVDVESATETAAAFNQAGVPAHVVTGKTPTDLRSHLMRRFAAGEFKQLCVVDIVSEGTDIPAIDVVSLARPSQSYTLVTQQIGRSLRPRAGKTLARIIDHVGNVQRFARAQMCPSTGRTTIEFDRLNWSLDRRERRSRSTQEGIAPLRVCPSCASPYPAIDGRTCPFCKETTAPAGRSLPEQVDGDLTELSPEALLGLTREIERVDGAVRIPTTVTREVAFAITKRHRERQEAQTELRRVMALWGGAQTAKGMGVSKAQRVFFHTFGVDVASAQALGRADAEALQKRIWDRS